MHWVRNDSLFSEEDFGVFSFEPSESLVAEYRYENECPGQCRQPDCYPKLKTKGQWDSWLREWHSLPDSSRQNGIAILFGARAEEGPWPGNIVSELPICAETFEKLVDTFHIHRSISRVINRNTTATISSITTRDPETQELQIVYNCRSASSWSDDIALSSTFCPSRNYTYCVVYGCSEPNRATIMTTLEKCDLQTYHPLILPLVFAEIERKRHFKMTDRIRSKLLTRALNVSRNRHGSGSNHDENVAETTAADTDGTLRLWLEMSHLKNGLESWRKQLEKITRHAEALSRADLAPDEWGSRPSSESSESTPVTTELFIPDGFDKLKNGLSDEDGREKSKTMPRIMARLEELREEYDEKIRSCGTIVDGMILATQMEWNEIGRGDTLTNLEIAKATRNDGKQMRSIALLTMIFLPATSVATLFSMTFFNWSPDKDQSMMSPYIWLYATVTLVLTCVTVGTWYTCNRPRGDQSSLC
ncbi:hypothetical protein F5883DRAFT_468726 [Diaporthe sp. PMI_573]|nr:hypothetical protein F5883DRAFT_468726 [Diaporthaceae sp. PMI_573]